MTPAEAADVLEASGRAFVDLLGSITQELASWRPAQDEWCEKPAQQLADELEALRRESIAMLRIVPSNQLSRAGTHPRVGKLSVNDLLHEWVHHDGEHLRQVLANVEAYVWPEMGNAQRFSKP